MAKANKLFSELSSAVYEKDEAAVRKVLEKVEADAQPYNAYGESLVMSAIDNNAKLSLIKLLVEQGGARLAWKSSRGETPISVAQQRDRAEVIDYFASRGAKCT